MFNLIGRKFAQLSLGAKISAIVFLLVSLLITVLILLISHSNSQQVEEDAIAMMNDKTSTMVDAIDLVDRNLRHETGLLSSVFRDNLGGAITADPNAVVNAGGFKVPTLKSGSTIINDNTAIPDKFRTMTGAVCTVFARAGEEFVRVTTSIETQEGQRAVGTSLDHSSAAYASLHDGNSYMGTTTLFDKEYMASYEPVKDAQGKVIGALFVGLDLSSSVQAVKDKIHSFKLGKTGYFYVLDARPGKNYGNLIVHPTKAGTNILASKDASGREFIREILERRNGTTRYPWQNKELGETSARDKIAAFSTINSWNWVIVGSVYSDEIVAKSTAMRNQFALIGIILVFVMAAISYPIIRQRITKPLMAATAAAQKLASGDLTISLAETRQDEIGALLHAMNEIGTGLTNIVGNVRATTESIETASGQIAAGNMDLSARTESQASALEQTASSMEQLTSTVKQNGESARRANALAVSASTVASRGGDAVMKVVETMDAINESSKKISEIISVIDSIAFQTNILALNAAVEAARAGEQGRGFAVVATEVRNLAQRAASASSDIKHLIDASVERVAIGSEQVNQAGVTMKEIVLSVKRVTDIMTEIDVASHEQEAGIEQVNVAISEMDSATQQNAALVEEAAAAAASLRDQAQALTDLVGTFVIDDAGHRTEGGQHRDARSSVTVSHSRGDAARLMRLTA